MKNIIINFKNYWFLITQLISRDFKVKYKRSVLGVVWSLLNPILMMTVMSIVFSHMFKMKVEGQNYLVYLMTGIIMWNFFSEATNMSMVSVVDNFSLINKIYIPKYVFPISKVLFVCINFMLTLIPWIGIIILSNFHNSSEIKESNLIINDKEYKVDLDGNFFDTSNAAIWLFSDRYYVLEKNGIDGELYTSKEYEHTFGNTKDELIKRFPGLLKIPRMTYRIIQKFKKINYVFLEI